MSSAKTSANTVRSEIPVKGMTCAACETRVGKALRTLPGVSNVKVSVRTGTAEVVSRNALDMNRVQLALEKIGYEVGKTTRPLVTTEKSIWIDAIIAIASCGALVMLWQCLGLGRIGDAASQAATSGNLVFVVLLGMAASVSTCMALVGGIVMGLSASHAEKHPDATPSQRLRPQVMFNIGRIAGFTLLGAIVGIIGSAISMNGRFLGIAMIVVAVVMAVLGLKLTGLSPRLAAVNFTLPSTLTNWMYRGGTPSARYRDQNSLLLGAASFFLPCGFTQAVQVYALSTGNPMEAGLVMGLFALGTTPGLMGIGWLASAARGPKGTRILHYVGVAVLAFALVNFIGGWNSLAPSTAPAQTITTGQRSENVTEQNGVQLVKTTVDGRGYSPYETIIHAGTPVQWQLDVKSLSCASIINGTSLGLAEPLYLQQGVTTVNLSFPEPGNYPYSCGMGMYTGVFTVIEKTPQRQP